MGIYRYLRDKKQIQEIKALKSDPDFVKSLHESLTYKVCAKHCKHFEVLKKEANEHGFSMAYDRLYDAHCKNCVIALSVNIEALEKAEAEEAN